MQEKFAKKFESLNAPFGLQMLAIKRLNDLMGEELIKDEFYFYKENYNIVYVYQHEIQNVRNYCLKKLKTDPQYLKNLYKTADSLFSDFKNKEDKFAKAIDSLKTIEEIKLWLRDFSEYASTITPIGYFVEMFAGYDSFWLDYTGLSKDDFSTLTSPEELSFSKEYEFEIAKFKLSDNKDVSGLVTKWYWVRNNYFIVDLVDKKYIETQLESISTKEAQKTVDEIGHTTSNIKSKKQEILNRLSLGGDKLTLLEGLASFVVLQDRRKEVALKTTSFLVRAYKKLLDLYEYSETDKQLVLSASLHFWFYELSKEKLLENSRIAFGGVYSPISGEILIGSDAVKTNDELANEGKEEHVAEIKGQVAYRGKLTGRACIVLRNTDFAKFKDGDILVASMTRPEFVPLMKMASAFVTDEGGITCHASIVARELKKPCIIGTKIATKVLKDGDMVEVDADTGIVRIIK